MLNDADIFNSIFKYMCTCTNANVWDHYFILVAAARTLAALATLRAPYVLVFSATPSASIHGRGSRGVVPKASNVSPNQFGWSNPF